MSQLNINQVPLISVVIMSDGLSSCTSVNQESTPQIWCIYWATPGSEIHIPTQRIHLFINPSAKLNINAIKSSIY